MKRITAIILSVVLVLACACIPAFADDSTTVEIVMSQQDFTNSQVVNSVTSGSVTVTLDKGTGSNDPAYYESGPDVRLYSKGVMTVSAGTDATITSIVFSFTSEKEKGVGALEPDVGSYSLDKTVGTWTGSAAAVTFTNTKGQARMASIKVTYTGGTAASDPTPPAETTEPELNTPEAILKALYALDQGETLTGGPYTLTGKITAVNTAYSADFNNITVTIAVDGLEDYPVQCYRMIGDGIDVIGVGYEITVTGTLKNFKGTKEFDAKCTLDKYTAPAEEPDEPEQPELKTAEEILKALYALGQGETLYGGPYTLTGKITAVNTAYSAEFNNITVTITVDGLEDYPVQCYRMIGDGIDVIGVGYEITVTGTLKDYKGTKEFDAKCTLDKYTAPAEEPDEPEQPELKTAEAILKALYALDQNAALYGGPYTLTGKITAINTVYSSQFNNVTVTMAVEGLEDYPVQCYRMVGDGVDIIDVDDTITVTGYLKDYKGTKEFDANCTLDSYEHKETEKEDVSKLTPEEILERLYALNDGENLTDVYTLTGKIISVDTPWDDRYANITVTIEVEGHPDKPVMCYRLAGEGADGLAVDDVITVAGTFKNHRGTYEFNQGCELLNVVKAQTENVQTGDCGYIAVFAIICFTALAGCLVLKKKAAR